MAEQNVRAELYYDGDWHDHTNSDAGVGRGVYRRNPIEIAAGRGDQQGEPTASTCALTFDNRAGLYNPRNPSGPLFGKIGRNTPLRVSVGLSPTRFDDFNRAASGWSGGPFVWNLSGGTVPTDYSINGTKALQAHPAANVLHYSYTDLGESDHRVRATINISVATPTGAGVTVFVLGRMTNPSNWYAARMMYTTTGEVTFGLAKTVAGLGAAITTPVTTHTGYTGLFGVVQFTVEFLVEGSTLYGKIWDATNGDEPSAWNVIARDTDLTTGTFGGVASRRDTGNTNANLVVAYDSAQAVPGTIRFTGEVSSWKPRRAVKGDAWTLVEASGVLRRLSQGEEPQMSPWRRTITSAQTSGILLAYWPCEDQADSTAVASALGTGSAMTVTGTVAFADSGDTFRISAATTLAAGFGRKLNVGTDPLPNLAGGGKFVGTVPAGVSSPIAWTVSWVSRTNAIQAGENIVIARWFTPGGTYVRWDFVQKSNGLGYDLLAFTSVGGAGQVTLATSVNDEVALTEYRISALQNGTNTQVTLWVAGNQVDLNNYITTTNARVTSVEMNPDSNSITGVSGFWVGHVRVWDASGAAPGLGYSNVGQPTQVLDADGVKIYPWLGHLNERATDRIARLFRERGVPLRLIGLRTDGVRMGPQPTETLTGLIGEIERTDRGALSDDRLAVGVTYRTRSDLYGQTVPVLALDFGDVAPPLDPDIDDLNVYNDVTVKRSNGSSARAVLQSGDLSILPPPNGIGRASRPLDVNPALDSDLPALASWYLARGTIPGTRYSQVTVFLANPGPVTTAAARVTDGDLLTITDIDDDEDATLYVLGRQEVIDSHIRTITFNATLAE